MSREVRRVPMDWQHPMEWRERWDRQAGTTRMQLVPRPLFNDYAGALSWQEPEDGELNRADYMPDFPEGTATGWCMYETTSEGTPISPVFETPEALAQWLSDTGASAFGRSTATYDQWLRMIQGPGWAPSAVGSGGALMSGVEFAAKEG